MSKDNLVQSIVRAAKILEILAEEEDLGVTEISKALALHKSTVHRILSTLVALGYVEQNQETEKYCLGMKLLFLGGTILDRMDIRKESRVYLKELAEEVKETAHLVIPDGYKALYIDKWEGNKTIRMYSKIGRRAPMHASAVGKAILAFSSKEYVEKVIDQGLKKYTSNTIIDPEQLKSHLEKISQLGFAIDDEENEKGIRCIGAPIFDYTGEVVGAISLSGPTINVTKAEVKPLSVKVINCANKISRRMGWSERLKI